MVEQDYLKKGFKVPRGIKKKLEKGCSLEDLYVVKEPKKCKDSDSLSSSEEDDGANDADLGEANDESFTSAKNEEKTDSFEDESREEEEIVTGLANIEKSKDRIRNYEERKKAEAAILLLDQKRNYFTKLADYGLVAMVGTWIWKLFYRVIAGNEEIVDDSIVDEITDEETENTEKGDGFFTELSHYGMLAAIEWLIDFVVTG